ncbi:MAG TPA: TAXI family TRAP transporter solute-binding subunit [Candidatus Binatia bacterium]|nr:TAXI family TRAP transporter solute-binding subunit [Candidatus Binatia bacterium]
MGNDRIILIITLCLILLTCFIILPADAQVKNRISIATGGTGGVYYPLGGGMAALITKYIPNTEATAEVTTASVDNVKLLHGNRVGLAFSLPDTAWDGFNGQIRGLPEKANIRSLMALYANFMHIVATDGSGIKSVADLKGKRVSTGSPGSGVEVKGLRVLEAYGLTPKDFRSQERLGAAESAGALKDRKIDAFFWDGGLPTGAVLDLAATPGIKIHMVPHGDAIPKMVAKYGPLYFAANIPKGLYKGIDEDTPVAAATNLLIANEKLDENLAYQITKLLLEHTTDLVAVHKAAGEMNLKTAVVGSPIPFHPGALRYYKEKGVKVPVPSK